MKLHQISTFARRPATVSLAALAVATAVPAHAQASGESDSYSSGGEIVVIGVTKQAANIQDTPTAITAFNAATLEEKGITDVMSVADFTPGFNIRGGGNNPTAFNLSMRGQVQNDTLATLEPSVGVYLDEMYIARAYGLNSELVDISGVQVLKGPQGTLFGRNTSAGALLLRTNDPVMGEFSGLVRGTYGRFDQREGTAVVNVPLGENVALRGAVFYGKRNDYQKDVRRNVGYGARETLNGRVKLSADITPTLNLLLSGEWYRSDIDGPARTNRLFYLGGTDIGAADRALTGGNPNKVTITDPTTYPGAPAPDLFNKIRTQTYIGKLTLDTSFGEMKFITGYRRIKGNNLIDLDGLPFPGHFTQGIQDLKQYSGELQITGQAFDDIVDFAAGLTYFKETGTDISRSSTNLSASWSGFSGDIDNDSFGLYSQASLHVTDKLNINVGARYSLDDKGVTTQSAVYPGNGNLPQVCLPSSYMIGKSRTPAGDGTLLPSDCDRSRRDSFNHVSWTAGFDYSLNDDVMLYAKYSNGYRSGAQQLRSLTLTDTAPAQPEVVDEQEIGLKTRFLNGRATFNIAGYHNEVKGAQRSVILSISGTQQTILENADTETWGVEADASVEVVDGLQLFASGSYLDPKYKRYDGFIAVGGLLTPYDKSSNRFVGIARKQFAVGAAYDADVGVARLNLSANYSWQSKLNQHGEVAADFLRAGIPAAMVQDYIDATTSPATGITNARAALSFGPERNYEVAVWGRNIFNERTPIYTLFLGGLNYVSSAWNEPASYGVTATVRF
ncbi:MAG: TonB-dependent receptor [Novosphingobium sp.]|nr:TonB-dependent receptor [Novosphingobium sp.]